MSNASNTLKTSRSLPIALLRAREKVMRPIRDMLSSLGLTEQQWRVLRVLDEEGPLDATQISARSVLLLPSLSRILQALEDRELLRRAPDLVDRRKQKVFITEKGRAVIIENLAQSQKLNNWVYEGLGPEKLNILLDLLAEMDDLPRDPKA